MEAGKQAFFHTISWFAILCMLFYFAVDKGQVSFVSKLTCMPSLQKGWIAFLGLVLLSVPVLFFVLWIHACNQTIGYPDNVTLYHSYFPMALRGRFTTTIVSFVLCGVVVLLNTANLQHPKPLTRITAWALVLVGGALGFLNLFSMM